MGSSFSRPVALLVVLFVVFAGRVDAIELWKCAVNLQNQQYAAWNATHPTEPPPLFVLSYEQCLAECGSGLGDIDWGVFSQTFSTWLLPWIALMFQIPFGAEEPSGDILNFLLTIGSPALAAYSLQITFLNARWLSKAFVDIKYPNSKKIPTVISAFHHVPIEISSDRTLLSSLIVLPQNDGYWSSLLKGVKRIRRWSIPLMMNFVWVVVTMFLTIVGSFASVPPGDVGYGTVALWLFLLPLIIGWLHVGSEPEPNHLRECLETASALAWVASDKKDCPMLAEDVPGQQALAIEFEKAYHVPPAGRDELNTTPIFNYSRVFTWSQKAELVLELVKNANSNARRRIAVGSLGSGGDSAWVKAESGSIAHENRAGTADQVAQYCKMVYRPLKPDIPDTPSLRLSGTPSITSQSLQPDEHEPCDDPSRWATGVWGRVVLATALALFLQWGTTGGAIIIHYWAHPVGLGCRSFSFLMFTVLSTTSFFFFLASSILAHLSRPPPGKTDPRRRLRVFSRGAVLCRRLGKAVAIISALTVLLVCLFQSAGAFDICWCSSTTFDRGRVAVFHTTNYLTKTISKFWIGGLVMASSVAFLFGLSIYVGTPPHR